MPLPFDSRADIVKLTSAMRDLSRRLDEVVESLAAVTQVNEAMRIRLKCLTEQTTAKRTPEKETT